MIEPRTAYKHSPAVGNSRTYMGSVMTVAIGGESTRGRCAIVEIKAKPGNEPPPHVHEWEDEAYHIIEGSVEVHCGKRSFVAGAGDYVLIPQGAPHAFYILTPLLRMIVTVSAVDERPVGLDRYFIEMGEPATSLDLPTGDTTHAVADPTRAIQVSAANGTRILSAAETARVLPNYPGFGAVSR